MGLGCRRLVMAPEDGRAPVLRSCDCVILPKVTISTTFTHTSDTKCGMGLFLPMPAGVQTSGQQQDAPQVSFDTNPWHQHRPHWFGLRHQVQTPGCHLYL